MKNELCERLGIEFPIFAFSHCRDVVAAVSRAGGLGVLGAVAFTAEQLELELAWIDKNVAGKPYGLDTVMPAKYVGREEGELSQEKLDAMIPAEHKAWLESLLEKYDVPELTEKDARHLDLLGWSTSAGRAHVDVGLNHPIRLIANALGPPPEDIVKDAHDNGIMVAALCGSVRQAVKQKEAGVDIIIASGYEAGGHTGEVTTMVLVPQVVDAVGDTPVLAAGGIGDGRQMAAAFALGASGIWTGSVWLSTNESDVPDTLVDKMTAASSRDTKRSRCISGKPARQLVTTYTKAWDAEDCPGTLPMPLQGLLTAEASHRIHRYAEQGHEGAAELLGTPVGQVVGQMHGRKSSKDVVFNFVEGYVDAVERMHSALPKD